MRDNLDDIRREFDAIDREMARLFGQRMHLGAEAAAWKQAHGLPILDTQRQFDVQKRNGQYVPDPSLKDYYADFQHEVMKLTRDYEQKLVRNIHGRIKDGSVLSVCMGEDGYDIVIERGSLEHVGDYLNLNRKVLVVSDEGVPAEYADKVLSASAQGYRFVFPAGERNKNMQVYAAILSELVRHGFTRSDAVVAVGGGVAGDMAGFAAATYKRGIDFYNIPTTLLSQVDASIGGKTAIDFDGVKNVVGAFYQPQKVIIDTDTLKTLDKRLFNEGLVEALKMAATFSRPLFDKIRDAEHIEDDIDTIVIEALKLKKRVVEEDPHEQQLRRVLNFGHTVGHAIESACQGRYYHGECVGIGMLYFCSETVRLEIKSVLDKYGLPVSADIELDNIMSFISHDKKKEGDEVNVVYVSDIGSFELRRMDMASLKEIIRRTPEHHECQTDSVHAKLEQI